MSINRVHPWIGLDWVQVGCKLAVWLRGVWSAFDDIIRSVCDKINTHWVPLSSSVYITIPSRGFISDSSYLLQMAGLGTENQPDQFYFRPPTQRRSQVLCILARLFWRWRDPAPSLLARPNYGSIHEDFISRLTTIKMRIDAWFTSFCRANVYSIGLQAVARASQRKQ